MSVPAASRAAGRLPCLPGAAPGPADLAAHGLPGWRLQTLASGRVMPWLNGGGTTTELLRVPAQDEAAPFEWRVSVAQVGTSGPFSAFAGVDRQLAILQGGGLRLDSPGLWPQGCTLRALDPPHAGQPLLAFPGEAPIQATLTAGPLLDFNLMSWRARWQAQAQVETASATGRVLTPEPGTGTWLAWFALSDGLRLGAVAGDRHTSVSWPRHSLLWAREGATPCTAAAGTERVAAGAWIALRVCPV